MKRMLPVFLFIVLFFTSCDIHWFGTHWDVPWHVVLIVISPFLLFDALVFVLAGVKTSKTKYVCPKCDNTFYPKWYNGMWRSSNTSDMILRCPHCKSKQICHESYNQDK